MENFVTQIALQPAPTRMSPYSNGSFLARRSISDWLCLYIPELGLSYSTVRPRKSTCRRYMHANPLKAKLVEHPGDRSWSSW